MMSQHNLPGTSPRKEEKVENMTFSLPQPEPIKGFPELRWTGKRQPTLKKMIQYIFRHLYFLIAICIGTAIV